MIPIVEDVLTDIIEDKLKLLNKNVDIIDRIFEGASLNSRSKLKEYLSNNDINVVRGYPIERTKLPSFIVLLGQEAETKHSLGDYISDEPEYDINEVKEEVVTIKQQSRNRMMVKLKNSPLYNVDSITYNGTDVSDSFEIYDDKRSILQLYFPIDLNECDEVIVTYRYIHQGAEMFGSRFNCQYRVETWTSNGDLTILLYHLLKWMMLVSRDRLNANGIQEQALGGGDFEPAPEYFPEFVYRRALTFNCSVENMYQKEYDFLKEIGVEGEFTDPDVTID